MAKVNVSKVEIMNNPSSFLDNFKCEITFEVYESLNEDLEWKLTYVGSSETNKYDQVLDSVLVGPVPEGRHKFVFETPPPNPDLIPCRELVDVTVFLLSCSYRSKEFVTVGYFVTIQYTDDELKENPPDKPIFEKLQRFVDVKEPRVTRFKINWDDEAQAQGQGASGDKEEVGGDEKEGTQVPAEENKDPTMEIDEKNDEESKENSADSFTPAQETA